MMWRGVWVETGLRMRVCVCVVEGLVRGAIMKAEMKIEVEVVELLV